MTDLLNKIRFLTGDMATTGTDVYTYSNTSVFTLSEPNVVSVTDVYVNGVTSGVTHSYSSTTKKVTVSSAMTAGDTVEIEYTYYANYSDAELTSYMQAALVYLSVAGFLFEYDSDDDDIYPQLTSKEENLIALVTSISLTPDNCNIRLPDVSIVSTSNLSPRDRINQVIALYKKDTHGIFDVMD